MQIYEESCRKLRTCKKICAETGKKHEKNLWKIYRKWGRNKRKEFLNAFKNHKNFKESRGQCSKSGLKLKENFRIFEGMRKNENF